MEASQEHCKYHEDKQGGKHAVSSQISFSVLPEGDIKLFNRNALKKGIEGEEIERHERCVVGEMDGVRTYVRIVDGIVQVVMTRQDIYL